MQINNRKQLMSTIETLENRREFLLKINDENPNPPAISKLILELWEEAFERKYYTYDELQGFINTHEAEIDWMVEEQASDNNVPNFNHKMEIAQDYIQCYKKLQYKYADGFLKDLGEPLIDVSDGYVNGYTVEEMNKKLIDYSKEELLELYLAQQTKISDRRRQGYGYQDLLTNASIIAIRLQALS